MGGLMKKLGAFSFDVQSIFSDIPILFPVGDWVALNPLSDCTQDHFHAVIQRLRTIPNYQGYLTVSEYIQRYQSGLIRGSALEKACRAYSHLNISPEEMLDEPIQKKLELISEWKINQSDQLITTQLYQLGFPDMQDWMEIRIQTFLSAWFDQGLAAWRMPSCQVELWLAWKDLTRHENCIWQQQIDLLPDELDQACLYLLTELGIPSEFFEDYLRQISHRLLGWLSLIKANIRYPSQVSLQKNSHLLSPILIWLSQEKYYLKKIEKAQTQIREQFKFSMKDSSSSEIKLNHHLQIWQRALEFQEQDALLSILKNDKKQLFSMGKSSKSQWVFCMDPRSHAQRTVIESKLQQETLGVAGFFGFPFQLENCHTHQSETKAPFLISSEIILKLNECCLENKKSKVGFWKVIQAFSFGKSDFIAPYFLFEMIGSVFLWQWIRQTFFASSENRKKAITADIHIWKSPDLPSGFTLESASEAAYAFLQQCNLSNRLSEMVVLCAHATWVVNHPQQASLECGACGGHSGEWNAIVACDILNEHSVREVLALKGISIPASTRFIPALHLTSTQTIQFLTHKENIPKWLWDQHLILNRYSSESVQKNCLIEKANPLHWAELIPEWGLAGNALLVIGPSVCAQVSALQGRCFLQTYDSQSDGDGEILKTVLDSVALVAHQINAQYYFSSTDPLYYGGGNKALHNVVGNVGVMEGNLSDLKIGLSLQSLVFRGERVHIPVRLTVVVFAESDFVSEVVQRTQYFSQLVQNEWIFLKVLGDARA